MCFTAVMEQHVHQFLEMSLCLLKMQMLEAVRDSKSLGEGLGKSHQG